MNKAEQPQDASAKCNVQENIAGAESSNGDETDFEVTARLDTVVKVARVKMGGILM